MKKARLALLAFLAIIFVYSCSENGSSPRQSQNDERLAKFYEAQPDVPNCYEGELKATEKNKVLARVNYFRRIHKLPLVGYNPTFDPYAQKSALISVANRKLDHYPKSNYKCYSAIGDTGCQKGNLFLSWASQYVEVPSENAVDGWIKEKNSPTIGHRRWILLPFLKNVAFGRVDYIGTDEYRVASTLYVFDFSNKTDAGVEFIACPYNDYPVSAIDSSSVFSFTVLADKNNFWGENKNVDFSKASVSIVGENGPIAIYDVKYDNVGYGLPNCLQWRTRGIEYGKRYQATVSNAIVNGKSKNYSYYFRLINN